MSAKKTPRVQSPKNHAASHARGRAPRPKPQPKEAAAAPRPRRRAVVVGGSRTPFTKAFSELIELDALGLAAACTRDLLRKTGVSPREIEEIVWGSVVVSSQSPNTARELVFELDLPPHIPGFTLTRACLSGLSAICEGVKSIERGDMDCVLAGGSDSVSNAEMPLPRPLVRALGKLSYGGRLSFGKVLRALKGLGSLDAVLPKPPRIAERVTGRTMGQHADDMARQNGVTREAQDAFALRSHQRAQAAWDEGLLGPEVAEISLGRGRTLSRDTLVRGQADPKKVAKLRPAFGKGGTVTAASSSPLTDGGSAVLLMSEEKAKALGLQADIQVVDWITVGVDPFDQLLIGPALAIPKLCDRHGLTIDDIDIFEIHEAFAAQVLSVTDALASDAFCRARLGREKAFGRIPDEKLNPFGGSIAIGHPFAATGGRLVTTAANALRRMKKKRAIIAICAAGGMGGAALLERIGG